MRHGKPNETPYSETTLKRRSQYGRIHQELTTGNLKVLLLVVAALAVAIGTVIIVGYRTLETHEPSQFSETDRVLVEFLAPNE